MFNKSVLVRSFQRAFAYSIFATVLLKTGSNILMLDICIILFCHSDLALMYKLFNRVGNGHERMCSCIHEVLGDAGKTLVLNEDINKDPMKFAQVEIDLYTSFLCRSMFVACMPNLGRWSRWVAQSWEWW